MFIVQATGYFASSVIDEEKKSFITLAAGRLAKSGASLS